MGMTYYRTNMPKGWSGLSADLIVIQSHLIHPDWDSAMHAWYLAEEEGINLEHLPSLPTERSPLETIARWVAEFDADPLGRM